MFQHTPVASCPVAVYPWEESGSVPSAFSIMWLQTAVSFPLLSPTRPLRMNKSIALSFCLYAPCSPALSPLRSLLLDLLTYSNAFLIQRWAVLVYWFSLFHVKAVGKTQLVL